MIYFSSQPSDKPIGPWIKEVTREWCAAWDYKKHERTLVVPAGYTYDSASVPRWAWSITGLRPDGLIRAASLAHDALYRAKGGLKPEEWKGCSFTPPHATRKEADTVFYEAMVFAGMKKARARIAYLAVRIGGKRYWGHSAPNSVEVRRIEDH